MAPLEVGNCILELADVAEVAVVPAPHRVLGQVAKAYVVPRNGTPLVKRSIVNHCARQLPSHKVPFFVNIVGSLPKSGTGKTLHFKLIEESR